MTTEKKNGKHGVSFGEDKIKSLPHGNSRRVVHFQEDVDGHDHVQQLHLSVDHEKKVGSDSNDTANVVDALGRQIDASLSLGEALSINLGMLKCGFRYAATVNVPLPSSLFSTGEQEKQQNHNATEGVQNLEGEADHRVLRYSEMVHLVSSIDEDLHAEIIDIRQRDQHPSCGDDSGENLQKGHSSDEDKKYSNNDDRINNMTDFVVVLRIELAARRPGPYRGRFALEWVSKGYAANGNESLVASLDEKEKYTSLQIDAVLMDKDKGTPCLKANIRCTGKLVGYDSDEDTDWQGFD